MFPHLTCETPRLNALSSQRCYKFEWFDIPPLRNLPKLRVLQSVGKKIEQFRGKSEATADGFGRFAAHLGADRIEVHEPGLEDRLCHSLQGFVHAAIQFDLVV